MACTFSCVMKFTVKDCDPTTGEADDEGYEDEYVVSATGPAHGVCTRVRWLRFRCRKRALVFNLKNMCSSVTRKPGKYKNKYTQTGKR